MVVHAGDLSAWEVETGWRLRSWSRKPLVKWGKIQKKRQDRKAKADWLVWVCLSLFDFVLLLNLQSLDFPFQKVRILGTSKDFLIPTQFFEFFLQMQIKALTIWIAVIKERKAVSRSSYNFPFSECGFSLLKANGSEV